MRNHIFVRPARPTDAKVFAEWSRSTESNEWDPLVAKCPTTVTLAAYDQSGPLVFMPVQQPMMLDSLAVRPGLSKREVARSIKALVETTAMLAATKGVGEIYFLGTEEGTDLFAENRMFERLPWPVYRVKLANLEREA